MKAQLTPAELRDAERTLHSHLALLTDDVEKIEVNTLEPSGDPQGQPADEGGDDAAFERDRPTLAVEDTLGYEIREALRRISVGTYGVCEDCRQPIERVRLAIVPEARACSACARVAETG